MEEPSGPNLKKRLQWPLGVRFDEALLLASSLHRKQVRKASGVPYVAHLLGVASLVLEEGGSEDMVIAALLHDAAEDQGGEATLSGIQAAKWRDGCVRPAIRLNCRSRSGRRARRITLLRFRWQIRKRG